MFTNKIISTDRFHEGMSGCGLWFIYVYTDGSEIKVDYHLIGIFVERRTVQFDIMLCNKLGVLMRRLDELN